MERIKCGSYNDGDTDQGELTNRGIEGLEYVEIPPDLTTKGSKEKELPSRMIRWK